jgi:betaine-aldehyde dehydrogenase
MADNPLPTHFGLYYGGAWHAPLQGGYGDVVNPADGQRLAEVAIATAADVDAAVAAAQAGFEVWRDVAPLERGRILREVGKVIREHGPELALLDALDCGNPVAEMGRDAMMSAATFDFFAGLVTEMKGDSIPMGPNAVNFTVLEPIGVVARIVAFNHPFMFVASKAAAPLAAGNAVIMKPPHQAPLSALRLAELVGHLLPPGVLNILPGEGEAGQALSSHPGVGMTALIGSVETGRKVLQAGAATIKPTLLELGGKNALIAFADADPRQVAEAMCDGMNFTWCGQSCGSTSRAFLHESIHDAVLAHAKQAIARYRPGIPADPKTTMGALINRQQYERALSYIEIGKAEGATLVYGGKTPDDPALAGGYFIEPTIFTDVTSDMRIASEEIFGPVLSVLKWSDEQDLIRRINSVEYGLTCSIWTDHLQTAHRVARAVEAGFVWVNEVGKHFLGAPYGGFKQSGIGREECLSELLAFTREKNIHIRLSH